MDEIVPLIFHGCKLARDLESNLPNLAKQPHILWKNFDDITRIFSDTRDRINAHLSCDQVETNIDAGMQQWLRYSPALQKDLLYLPQLSEQQDSGFEGIIAPSLDELWTSGGGEEVQPMDVPDSARGSLTRSTRRRKGDAEKLTVRVPAPRMVNTRIPPEDGYTWRKYGQKEIFGSRFPRGYYRCTHQKLYQCPAKKQVQRLDHDPFTFEVSYRGDHTCTMSSTLPSVSVPPASIENDTSKSQRAATNSRHWLSMDIRPPPTGELAGTSSTSSGFVEMQMYSNFSLSVSSTSGMVDGGLGGYGGACPSTVVRLGKDDAADHNYYHPVVEYADFMFNSGMQ